MKKWKTLEILYFTQVYHKWQYMYGSWDMMQDGQFFLSLWTIFYPFTPITTQIKILKNWKKAHGDVIILHKCTKNHYHMLFCSWDMVHDRCNYYFSFCTLFALLPTPPPLTAQKIKILQKSKKQLEASSFYICVAKIMVRWCTVPEIWCVTDGQTDGKSDI